MAYDAPLPPKKNFIGYFILILLGLRPYLSSIKSTLFNAKNEENRDSSPTSVAAPADFMVSQHGPKWSTSYGEGAVGPLHHTIDRKTPM